MGAKKKNEGLVFLRAPRVYQEEIGRRIKIGASEFHFKLDDSIEHSIYISNL